MPPWVLLAVSKAAFGEAHGEAVNEVSPKSLTGYPFGRELGLISNSVSFGREGHHGRVNDIGVGGAAG